MDFDEKSTLQEVLEFSGAEDVLLEYKVPCLGCPMAKMEMGDLTLGQICSAYGIDCDKLIAGLNRAAESYK